MKTQSALTTADITKLPHHPLTTMYVYLTERCNLACRHCWVSAVRATRPEAHPVSVDTLCTILEAAKPLGLRYVKVSGGEPLLRKDDLMVLLEFLYRLGVATRIETNGTLIDDTVADAIQRCRTQVSISLDGSTAQIHEALRGVSGCFNATIAALDLLKARGIPVGITFALYRGNMNDLRNVVKLIEDAPCPSVKVNPVVAVGRASTLRSCAEKLTAGQLLAFARQVEAEYKECQVPIYLTVPPAFSSLSYILKRRVSGGRCNFTHLLSILANGSIAFCGMGYRASEFLFGRAGEINLKALWEEHPVLKSIRSALPADLLGVCSNCILRTDCHGGCRADAYERYHSLVAPEPWCQELYESGQFPQHRLVNPERPCHYESSVVKLTGVAL